MKKIYILVILSIFSTYFSFGTINKKLSDSVDVILSIKSNDKEAYALVRQTLKSMPGVTYIAYCENHSVFAVLINNDIYQDKKTFIEKVQKNSNADFKIGLKEGKLKELVSSCSLIDNNDSATLKEIK